MKLTIRDKQALRALTRAGQCGYMADQLAHLLTTNENNVRARMSRLARWDPPLVESSRGPYGGYAFYRLTPAGKKAR